MKHTGFPKDDILDVFYFCYGFLLILPAHYRLFYGFPVKLIQLLKFSTKESLLIQFFCEPGILISFPRPVPIFLARRYLQLYRQKQEKKCRVYLDPRFLGKNRNWKISIILFPAPTSVALHRWTRTAWECSQNVVSQTAHKLLFADNCIYGGHESGRSTVNSERELKATSYLSPPPFPGHFPLKRGASRVDKNRKADLF